MTDTRRYLLKAAVVIALSLASSAQQAERAFNNVAEHFTVSGSGVRELLSIRSRDGASATAQWFGSSMSARIDLPFDLVGSVARIAERQFIVSGAQSGSNSVGSLVRLSIDATTSSLQIVESVVYPGRDLHAIAWSPHYQALAAVDLAADELLFAPLVSPVGTAQPVLPSPGSLILAMTASSCDALGATSPTLRAQDSKFMLWATKHAIAYQVGLSPAGWAVEPSPVLTPANRWIADAERGHAEPVLVMTLNGSLSANNTFNVVRRSTGLVCGSGQVTATREWAPAGPIQAFYDYPGEAFEISGPLSATSRAFRPLLRYGLPQTGGVVETGTATLAADMVYWGSPRAGFWVPTKLPSWVSGAPAVDLPGYLLIGFGLRGSGAPPDPVIGTGQSARLQFSIALHVPFAQRAAGALCGVDIAIPSDPEIEGLILLSQWAFLDPQSQQFVFSDIVGARVTAPHANIYGALLGGGSSAASGGAPGASGGAGAFGGGPSAFSSGGLTPLNFEAAKARVVAALRAQPALRPASSTVAQQLMLGQN